MFRTAKKKRLECGKHQASSRPSSLARVTSQRIRRFGPGLDLPRRTLSVCHVAPRRTKNFPPSHPVAQKNFPRRTPSHVFVCVELQMPIKQSRRRLMDFSFFFLVTLHFSFFFPQLFAAKKDARASKFAKVCQKER